MKHLGDKYLVELDQLSRPVNPKDITDDFQLSVPIDLVGQERAQKALNVALSSEENRFHVLVVAEDIPLKIIAEYVQTQIAQRKEHGEAFHLSDYCYVYNFRNPSAPALICFPAGKSKEFKQLLLDIREKLKREMPFAVQQFELLKPMILSPFVGTALNEAKTCWQSFERTELFCRWREQGLRVRFSQTWRAEDGIKASFNLSIVTRDTEGSQKIISGKDIDAFLSGLPEAERSKYNEMLMEAAIETAKIQRGIEEIYFYHIRLAEDRLDAEAKLLYASVVSNIFCKTIEYSCGNDVAKNFLEGLQNYVLNEIIDLFLPQYQQQMVIGSKGPVQQTQQISFEELRAQMQMEMNQDPLLPFQINIFIDNGDNTPPPVMVETAATYTNLFGKIETSLPAWQRGIPITDHTKLLPGSFHRANGGFLILDLNDLLLIKQTVLLALKRTLHEKKIRIQDPSEEIGIASGLLTLFPEPIDMEFKIIALVKPELYHLLWGNVFYRELVEKFKIVAFCDQTVKKTPETINSYAAWMRSYAANKSLRTFAPEALAKIMNYLARNAGTQNYLDCDIELIKTIMREAHFYAEAEGTPSVTADHVKKAIAEKTHRSNLIEENFRKRIETGLVQIEVRDRQIGQVNGLAVFEVDSHRFGIPTRITVTTYRGTKGLINIQREAKLSGNTLIMGVEILQGFFYERYGQNDAVGFEGRIVFEQNYGLIDGPSATAAQLLALLSSLSRKPIAQGIAITGTVDQKGNVGAIGGVNEKIEGFFNTCKASELTGEQGVIIPKSNLQHLTLSEEVEEAVRKGQFRIYAIASIDEGIKILMNCQMTEIDQKVAERLKSWNLKDKNKKD